MTSRGNKGRTSTILPLFPLQTVLLPGTNLPLYLFEPRYRQLMVDLMTDRFPHRHFGIIAIKTALIDEVDSIEHVERTGCTALLREVKQLPDGRFDIVTTGKQRFELLDIDNTIAPYLMGTVRYLQDEPIASGNAEVVKKLSEIARSAHRHYCEAAWDLQDWNAPPDDTKINELAYLLSSDCLLPLADRQLLLEERHPLRRLQIICQLMTREAGFLATLGAVPIPSSEFLDAQPLNMN